LSLSAAELTTVDRLEVRLTLSRSAGVAAGELAFEPEAAGWTVISHTASSPRLEADGSVHTTWTWMLEPFLDGQYTIPSASVELHDAAHSTLLSTPAQQVSVASVLQGDEATLAEIRGPVDVVRTESAQGRHTSAIVGVGTATAVILAALIYRRRAVRRRHRPAGAIDPDRPKGARDRAASLRRELVISLSHRFGDVPFSATSDELLLLARGRLESHQLDLLQTALAQLDAMCYGPDEPGDDQLDRLAEAVARITGQGVAA